MKIYQSLAWLYDRYYIKRMNIKEMAKEANCSPQTIQNYLEKNNLIRNGRSWGQK